MRALRPLIPIALLPAAALATFAACHSAEENQCSLGGCGVTAPTNLGQSVAVSSVPPPPVSGGTLTVTRDGRTAIAADPDRDRVLVVDLAGRAIRSTIETEPFAEPGRSVEGANGVGYVALRRGGRVLSIDLRTGGQLGETDVCPAPRGLAFDAERRELHVACAGGELVTFQTARTRTLRSADGALTEVRRLTLEDDLRDVVISGDALLVSHFRSAAIDRVDLSGSVRRRPGPARGSSDGVTSFDPTVAWRMVGTADGGAVVIHQQSRSDALDVLDSALLPSEPTSSSSATSGAGGGGSAGAYGAAGVVCDRVAVHAQITRLDADGKSRDDDPGHGSLAQMPVPVDVAVSRLGGFVAMISVGQGRVFEGRLDMLAGADNCQANLPMSSPPPPDEPALGDPSGGRMIPSSREPIALAYGADDGLVVQLREPSAIEIHEPASGSIVATIPLGGPSRNDTAHTMFHSSPDDKPLQISCASCHPEGRDDGHVWIFADGPKRTQSLAGFSRVAASFHWPGDIPDVATLVDTIYTGRMGAEPQSIVRKAALFDWLGHMPHAPALGGVDGAAAARGRAIFEDPAVGCATCHGGSRFTDDRTVDVGTGGRFKTPSLRGVGARAPFMHDGCAPTLRDRFVAPCGGGDAHGRTSELDPAQVDDLVAFMSSL